MITYYKALRPQRKRTSSSNSSDSNITVTATPERARCIQLRELLKVRRENGELLY